MASCVQRSTNRKNKHVHVLTLRENNIKSYSINDLSNWANEKITDPEFYVNGNIDDQPMFIHQEPDGTISFVLFIKLYKLSICEMCLVLFQLNEAMKHAPLLLCEKCEREFKQLWPVIVYCPECWERHSKQAFENYCNDAIHSLHEKEW